MCTRFVPEVNLISVPDVLICVSYLCTRNGSQIKEIWCTIKFICVPEVNFVPDMAPRYGPGIVNMCTILCTSKYFECYRIYTDMDHRYVIGP